MTTTNLQTLKLILVVVVILVLYSMSRLQENR